ncbi:hypothetical protein EMPS_03695 [Entomortierella parvispora]|uniref:Uncharacterized protein n=1 Tax=Entomortierella parvispora TaxID=205924 RepID=A0A9P3H7A9_9FUNG|nr:hypothetical protein EMPS_03695 [Entomortierella parvispora]
MSPPSANRGFSMRSLLATAGIAGLALLSSTFVPSANAAAVVTLGDASDSPGSIILGGLSSMVPKPASLIDRYLTPGLANVTNIGVSIQSPTQVIVHANASLSNPFGQVTMPLGQVGISIWLDNVSLANVTTSNLTIAGGTAPVAFNATIDVADGSKSPALQTSINNLVVALVGGSTPSGPPPVITLTDLTVAGNNLGMQPISIPVQPTPSGPIPAPKIGVVTSSPSTPSSPVTSPAAATASPPVIGLGGLINPNVTLAWPVLNKVVVEAVAGATLTAGVGFTWNNPLNIDLDIPYISIDVGLNGTRVVTVGIEAIQLTPGPMSADILVDLTFNNDPEAAVQVGAFVNDFLAGELFQVLNIGNLTFGTPGSNTSATGQLLNTLFSGITVDLPLTGIQTGAIEDLVLSYIKPYLPYNLSNLGGTGGVSTLLQYLQGLTVATASGHTLVISPKLVLPFPFLLDLNIPYFALDINLDENTLGQLFLADLVGSGQGQVAVSVGIGIVFKEPSLQIPATLAKLVNGLMTGAPGSLDILAGVSNLAIGVSPSDAVQTLSAVSVAVPISSVITGSINTGNLLGSIMSETNVTIANNAVSIKVGSVADLTIHEANIDVLPSNMVTVGINLDVFLGLPIVADIGYFGVQLQLDAAQLAAVSMDSGINYAGGTVDMNVDVAIAVGTGTAISGNVAQLVNAVIAHQTVNSTLGISGIVIGQSSTDLIDALSAIAVQLPLGGLLGSTAIPSLPSGFLNSTISQLGLTVSDLSLATIPNAGLSIGARAAFSNPFPISINVPYIGISGGLDNVDLLTIGVENLAALPGANSLQAEIDLNFNNAAAAQTKVATFLGELLGGQLGNTPEALTAHNLRIGASPTDYFDLLSQIDISIPSKEILTQANVNLLISKLGVNVTQVADNLLSNLQIGAISADLTKAPVMELGASVSVSNFSLPISVNIGYFGVDIALDTAALAHIDVPSINITTANNKLTLSIQAAVTIQDSPAVEADIAGLVNYFISNSTTSPVQNLVISNPLVGASITDNIQTFALIQYPVALPALLAKAKVYVNNLLSSLASGLSLNNIALSGLDVNLNSPSIISVQGGVQVKNLTLPADISISYVGVSLGLDTTPLANVTIPTLQLTNANNTLSVNFQVLANVLQSTDLSTQIANLVGSFLYPGQVVPPNTLSIYDPVFGGDASHLFYILSQIKVNIALAPYLQKISTMLNGTLAGSTGSNLLEGLDIGSLVVDLNTPQTIGIDAAISIKNITIPAEIQLNYVGLNVAINTIGLANIAVPQFTLASSNGALAITAHVDVALLTSDALTSAISSLVTGVISNQTTPATNIVISGITFGGSSTNVFTILSGIAVPINVAPYINKIPALLASSSSLMSRVSIGQLLVDLNTPQTIGIDTSVSIKNITLPAQIQLNYLGANIAIGQVPLVQLGIPSFNMTPSNGNLDISLHVNLALQESTALTQTINGLVQTVLAGQPIPTTQLVISGAAFGGSPTNVFTFLQGVQIPLDVTSILNKTLESAGGAAGASSLLNSIAISNLTVDLNSPQVIGIDASVLVKNFTLPAQIELNYVGANIAIGSVPLASVAIPTFTMAPSGNDLSLSVQVNVDLLSSPQLSSAISGLVSGILSNQTLPTTDIVLSGAVFGASVTNFFTILQGVTIPINITPYISKIESMLSGAGSLLGGIGLSGLNINLNQAPVIAIAANIDVKNLTLPAKLNVGYFGLNIGINNVSLAQVAIPKLVLGSTGSDLTIATQVDITLQETDASETMVAGLVNSVVAGQAPQGTITISGIAFGASQSNVFTILQDVSIPIPISKIMSLVPSTSGSAVNTTSILDALSLQSADINMKNPPSIGADIAIALMGYSFDAQLLLSYVSISAFLDTTPLATITVPGISLNSGSNQVDLTVNTLINLESGSAIQTEVANIVNGVLNNSTAASTNLVISNIAFGGSASSTFQILDKVQVSLPLTPYIQQITSLVGGLLSGSTSNTTTPAISVTQLDISATGANDLSIAVGASIGGIGSKISVEMPYIGLQVTTGGAGFVYPTINNLALANGQVSLTLDLPFQSAAQSIVSSLSTPVSQLMFSTVGTVSGSLVAGNILFGASASQAFNIASQVQVTIQLNDVFQKAQAYLNVHDSLHLSDMNTVLTTTGISATLGVTGIPLGTLPLKMNFPITLSGAYQNTPILNIQTTSMSLAASPWSLGASITVVEPAFATALAGMLPNILEWKNALQGVTLGNITLGSFTALGGLTITPPVVTLWDITLPLGSLSPHLSPLGMDFSVTFTNQGPMQVDVGSIDIMVQQGPTIDVIEITNLGGPIHLNNAAESGGANTLSLNASLKFSFLQFFDILAKLLNPAQNFQFVFSMTTSAGQPMPWLQNSLNQVPAAIFSNLLPILGDALSHVSFGL